MNNVNLIGRLTKDPKLKYIGELQTPVAEFIVAIDRSYKSKEGNNTDFIRIQTWNKQAENCNTYLNKGDLVGISGEIRVDKYTNKQGENKYITRVSAKTVKFLSSIKSNHTEKNVENKYYDSSDIFTNDEEQNRSENFELPF